MKKFITMYALLFIVFMSSSCILQQSSDEFIPLEETENVLNIIKSQNKEELKQYISKDTVKSVPELDAQTDELFEVLGKNFEVTDIKEAYFTQRT